MSYSEEIGKGPVFPIQLTLTDNNGFLWGTLDGDMEIIVSDLKSALAHSVGEMLRQEQIGHRLFELLEEPNSDIAIHLVKKFCIEYINSIEFRIKPLAYQDITVIHNYSTIHISIRSSLLGGGDIEPINVELTK